jgi:hypothetical protein
LTTDNSLIWSCNLGERFRQAKGDMDVIHFWLRHLGCGPDTIGYAAYSRTGPVKPRPQWSGSQSKAHVRAIVKAIGAFLRLVLGAPTFLNSAIGPEAEFLTKLVKLVLRGLWVLGDPHQLPEYFFRRGKLEKRISPFYTTGGVKSTRGTDFRAFDQSIGAPYHDLLVEVYFYLIYEGLSALGFPRKEALSRADTFAKTYTAMMRMGMNAAGLDGGVFRGTVQGEPSGIRTTTLDDTMLNLTFQFIVHAKASGMSVSELISDAASGEPENLALAALGDDCAYTSAWAVPDEAYEAVSGYGFEITPEKHRMLSHVITSEGAFREYPRVLTKALFRERPWADIDAAILSLDGIGASTSNAQYELLLKDIESRHLRGLKSLVGVGPAGIARAAERVAKKSNVPPRALLTAIRVKTLRGEPLSAAESALWAKWRLTIEAGERPYLTDKEMRETLTAQDIS